MSLRLSALEISRVAHVLFVIVMPYLIRHHTSIISLIRLILIQQRAQASSGGAPQAAEPSSELLSEQGDDGPNTSIHMNSVERKKGQLLQQLS